MSYWLAGGGKVRVGVLAAQGAFAEHIAALKRLGVDAIPVRVPEELDGIKGLIIPGGESTTISKLMLAYKLSDKIIKLAGKGIPIWGTCAGMILISNEISDANGVKPLGLMDITVRRNAFGRQKESFEAELKIPVLGKKPFPGVFIRAPLIEKVKSGEVLAKLGDRTIVAARQGQFLVTAFHPELTDDMRFHQYFLDIIKGK
ncbi:MAG: pyridoxal 5'-phosphate synthase glutaminase subunit PdxT [Dehalococcoidales bacterium]|nr:pyridoxal 5'-phosphate synthase glutaminase subunit PdxT [Dehalococcoidales bacterium]